MDTDFDFIIEDREAMMPVNDDDFLTWVNYHVGIKVEFHQDCNKLYKENFLNYLKEQLYEYYLDDIHGG